MVTWFIAMVDQRRPAYVRLMSTLGVINAMGVVGAIARGRPGLVVVFLVTTMAAVLAIYLTLSADRYDDGMGRRHHPTSHQRGRLT